jgi:CheY-like chemotaxis protein
VDDKKLTVLVVEDDPALRRLVVGYLNAMNFKVLEASDGRSGIERLKEHKPDLLCLDLMLPESSGYDVCEFVRSHEPTRDLPIMMMSARTLPEDRAHAEEVGANAYLTKPFTRAQFTQQIKDMLAQAPNLRGSTG